MHVAFLLLLGFLGFQGGSMRNERRPTRRFGRVCTFLGILGAAATGSSGVFLRGQAAPNDWQLGEIGNDGVTQEVSVDDACFQVTTIWGSTLGQYTDAATFIYEESKGDSALTVQLNSLDPAIVFDQIIALQFRESLEAHSAFCASGVRSNVSWQPLMLFRDIAWERGDRIIEDKRLFRDWGASPNLWIRCERRGDLFVGYSSKDGSQWTAFAEHEAVLPGTLLAGLSFAAGWEIPI